MHYSVYHCEIIDNKNRKSSLLFSLPFFMNLSVTCKIYSMQTKSLFLHKNLNFIRPPNRCDTSNDADNKAWLLHRCALDWSQKRPL